MNINDHVEVTLTNAGMDALIEGFRHPLNPADHGYTMKYLDTCYPGWGARTIRIQLWELMRVFGPHMAMGKPVLFTNNEMRI